MGISPDFLTATYFADTHPRFTLAPKISICHQPPLTLTPVTLALCPDCSKPTTGYPVPGPVRIFKLVTAVTVENFSRAISVGVGVGVAEGVGVAVASIDTVGTDTGGTVTGSGVTVGIWAI